jgi:hypothetical protein
MRRNRRLGCACSHVVAGVARRRTLGASAAATLAFDASAYVPADVAADLSTAQSYYASFSQAAKGITVGSGGRITLSDEATNYVADALVSTISVIAPEIGVAYAALMALAPKAGAGPGVCAVDPPAGPSPSQLAAWPHFTSWASFFGPYPLSTAATFESYANPVLQYNWELFQNCFSDRSVPAPVLLAQLIATWNATHLGPARTVTRTGLNPAGFSAHPVGYDPIADALEIAAVSHYVDPNANFEQSINQESSAPTNLSASFQVNNGPQVAHVAALTLHHLPLPGAAGAKAPTSSSSSAGTIVVVGGLLAAGAWAVHTGAAARALSSLKRIRI